MNTSPNAYCACHQPLSPCECSCLETSMSFDQYMAMRDQEELSAYDCADYLSSAKTSRLNSAKGGSSIEPIDVECRVRMVEWCFQVVDFAKLQRETVSVAMSLLDRYLSSQCPEASKVISSRKLYQLASMSALFLAIKMCEKVVVNASVFADLSRGSYNASDILRMESIILKSLSWRVNGPTTHAFLRYLTTMAWENCHCSLANSSTFTELCNFQLDLSVGDYFFCSKKPSTIALAAIINAVENSTQCCKFESSGFLEELEIISGADLLSVEVQSTKNRLRMLLKNNGVAIVTTKQAPVAERGMSPTCISRINHVDSSESMNDDDSFA